MPKDDFAVIFLMEYDTVCRDLFYNGSTSLPRMNDVKVSALHFLINCVEKKNWRF